MHAGLCASVSSVGNPESLPCSSATVQRARHATAVSFIVCAASEDKPAKSVARYAAGKPGNWLAWRANGEGAEGICGAALLAREHITIPAQDRTRLSCITRRMNRGQGFRRQCHVIFDRELSTPVNISPRTLPAVLIDQSLLAPCCTRWSWSSGA